MTMNPTTNPTLNIAVQVKYNLSAAGQKAALLAGLPATREVKTTMTLTDPAHVEYISIQSDGTTTLDAYAPTALSREIIAFDAPPQSIDEIVAEIRKRTAIHLERRAEAEMRRKKDEEDARIRREQASKQVEELLTQYEAVPHEQPLPGRGSIYGLGALYSPTGEYFLPITDAQKARLDTLARARRKVEEDRELAIQEEKEKARAEMAATYGGYRWEVEGGMCDFQGFALWNTAQSKRWVGTFTQPKGIDTFLPSPKGEHVFDVSRLSPGDCIQGAGFDTNSRGKRRSETEFFGRVVARDENQIVVEILDSRAACLRKR